MNGALRRWLAPWALWCISGLISATQLYWMYQLKEPVFTFTQTFLWQFPPWVFWALVTPGIVFLWKRRPLERSRNLWARAPIHLAAVAVCGLGHATTVFYSTRLAGIPYWANEGLLQVAPILLLKNAHLSLILYGGVLAVVAAAEYRRRYRDAELTRSQLETRLVQAQLESLKSQLHPHFLFNTLNAISVLVRKQDHQAAVKMLTGVSDLLRLALENVGRQVVPLKQELDFVERYLSIEQIRFPDRLRVSFDVAPETLEARLPNLLLQPLVENALKHGVAPRAAAGLVEIRAARDGERLRVEVLDDGPGMPVPCNNKGIGLSNVKARLEQLYPGSYRFEIGNRPEGGVAVRVELPYSPALEAGVEHEPASTNPGGHH